MTSVQSLVQNLWRHVALCTDSSVGGDVYLISVTAEPEIKVTILNRRPVIYERHWILRNKVQNTLIYEHFRPASGA